MSEQSGDSLKNRAPFLRASSSSEDDDSSSAWTAARASGISGVGCVRTRAANALDWLDKNELAQVTHWLVKNQLADLKISERVTLYKV